jgi:hypothetical protein
MDIVLRGAICFAGLYNDVSRTSESVYFPATRPPAFASHSSRHGLFLRRWRPRWSPYMISLHVLRMLALSPPCIDDSVYVWVIGGLVMRFLFRSGL